MAKTRIEGSLVLIEGLPAEEVDARLRRASRWVEVGNRAVAFYLAEVEQRGLYQVLGAPTVVAYAVRALGWSRRRVRELVMVGRRLRELPVVDQAFGEGTVSWSKVRRLCAVAVAETQDEWLAVAQRTSHEELERQLRGLRRGERPRRGAGLPGARFRVSVDLDALQQQMWENAREKLRAEMGWDAEVCDTDLLAEMVRLVLASDADGSVPGRRAVDGSIFRVVVRDGGDAVAVQTDDGEEPVHGTAAEVTLEAAAVSAKLRARVLARDRHRCQHCGCRRGLQLHHVQWRSRGGKSIASNLVTLCAKCHGLVHELLLEVAHRATGSELAVGTVGFVFRDKDGRRLDGRRLEEPRIRVDSQSGSSDPEVALCATSDVQAGAAAAVPDFSGTWLRDHLHWFGDGPRGLVVKPRYRGAFERRAVAAGLL